MKKLILSTIILAAFVSFASAQLLPTFQFGIKGGANLSNLSSQGNNFSSDNRAGYLGGIWARFGAVGFNFQPEMYVTGKDVNIYDNAGNETRAKFTSLDVPLLFGTKIGAFGFGGRIYTGPMVSFAINKDQTFTGAVDKATSLDYQNQNFAWQFGAGLDIQKISIDIRYEAGITKQTYNDDHTRVSLFNLTLAYSLFKL
jgi:hypothetical protein